MVRRVGTLFESRNRAVNGLNAVLRLSSEAFPGIRNANSSSRMKKVSGDKLKS